MSEGNRQLVIEFCRAYTAGDWDGMGKVLADGFRWRQPTNQERQSAALSGVPKLNAEPGWTKAETIEIFRQTAANCEGGHMDLTPVSTTAEEDRVAVEATSRAVNKANQRVYDNRYHILFVCRNGAITEMREYQDTLHVYDVWMAP